MSETDRNLLTPTGASGDGRSSGAPAPSGPRPAGVPSAAAPQAGAAPERSPLSARVESLRLSNLPDEPAGGTRLPWFLTLVLACTTVYFAWRTYSVPAAAISDAPPAATVPRVAVSDRGTASGESAAAAVALESKGYIIPTQQILVSPQVSGRLLRLNIEEGQRVEQGEILAELETTDYQADLDRARAVLAGARQRLAELERGNRPEEIRQVKAELDEATVQLNQMESEYSRARRLRGNNTISQSEFEQTESDYRSAEKRVARLANAYELMVAGPRIERIEQARAEVQQASADVAKADWRLSNCTIKAPISGTILKKNAEEGNIVNPIAFNGSFSLCEMADLSNLEVELSIQERDIAQIFRGQKCLVRAEAFPNRTYRGEVSRLMPIADRAKGAIPVRVKLTVPAEEEGVYLKPEMGAVVSFLNRAEGAANVSQAAPGSPPAP